MHKRVNRFLWQLTKINASTILYLWSGFFYIFPIFIVFKILLTASLNYSSFGLFIFWNTSIPPFLWMLCYWHYLYDDLFLHILRCLYLLLLVIILTRVIVLRSSSSSAPSRIILLQFILTNSITLLEKVTSLGLSFKNVTLSGLPFSRLVSSLKNTANKHCWPF